MANIPATVVKGQQGLVLKADRQSTCGHCQTRSSCATQWQVTNTTFLIPTSEDSSLAEGDVVLLQCNDGSLLLYFATLFLPMLASMLAISCLAVLYLPSLNPLASFSVQVVFPVVLGAFISRLLLRRWAPKLLSTSI